MMHCWKWLYVYACALAIRLALPLAHAQINSIGREVAIPQHLQNGQEFQISLSTLLEFGRQLFAANWTIQEGQGRPLAKGVEMPTGLSDPTSPLVFPRNFNRLSAPDANSCAGCHNVPIAGGAGDIVANVFVLGQRFDSISMDHADGVMTRGAVDESGNFVTMLNFADSRATPGMFGSGYLELLARDITADLRAIESTIQLGQSTWLFSKGINFGRLSRNVDGVWDTSGVNGLPPKALGSSGANNPPSLILQPWHQVGNVVSIRQFTTNAFNHHHGMQAEERVGTGVDQDGDGFVDELTRADITAATLFQASMAVPGRVIPDDPVLQAAILNGETLFAKIGCAVCHIPSLPLNNWLYTEPNPYNPPGNLIPGDSPVFTIDLTDRLLPRPRLMPVNGLIHVAAYTDFRLHDICSGPDDPNVEAINQNQPAGSPSFFAANRFFLTKRLWNVGSSPNHFHHGKYTTIRESILAVGVTHGFLLSVGQFASIDFPGASSTVAFGINPEGSIVGQYTTAGVTHGFLLSRDSFTTIDFPGASLTSLRAINSEGDIVGGYTTSGIGHGFLLKRGSYATIDFPGANLSIALGINPPGNIVGAYVTAGVTHGFLFSR